MCFATSKGVAPESFWDHWIIRVAAHLENICGRMRPLCRNEAKLLPLGRKFGKIAVSCGSTVRALLRCSSSEVAPSSGSTVRKRRIGRAL